MKRYNKDGYHAEHTEGKFVLFEDYATLQARVGKLEAALRKIADGRGLIPDASTIYMNGTQPDVPKVFSRNDMQEIAMRAIGVESEKK